MFLFSQWAKQVNYAGTEEEHSVDIPLAVTVDDEKSIMTTLTDKTEQEKAVALLKTLTGDASRLENAPLITNRFSYEPETGISISYHGSLAAIMNHAINNLN